MCGGGDVGEMAGGGGVRVAQLQAKESRLCSAGWSLCFPRTTCMENLLKCWFLGSVPSPGICTSTNIPSESYAALGSQMLLKVSGQRAMLCGILFLEIWRVG